MNKPQPSNTRQAKSKKIKASPSQSKSNNSSMKVKPRDSKLNSLWINPNSSIDRVTVLTQQDLIIVNPPKESLEQLESQLIQGNIPQKVKLLNPKFIPLSSITSVRANKYSENIAVYYVKANERRFETVYYENAQVRDQVVEELHKRLGSRFQHSVKKYNIFQAILAPGISLGAVAFFTYAFYTGALEMIAGQEPTIQGRNRLIKQLIVWSVSIIGPTGVIIIGGFLMLICLIWLIKNFVKPPVMSILSIQKES